MDTSLVLRTAHLCRRVSAWPIGKQALVAVGDRPGPEEIPGLISGEGLRKWRPSDPGTIDLRAVAGGM
ncbi:hypothetical protein H8F24_12510 [Synechococcus sp. CBW1002]|uniref:hypothetical protein n=1 Tax=Synechococcus sp. CBW1002 TaxID=1353134 RepID=UPI0018CD78E0|nr:hypothetical protein [Synechococcus sp. CBW1002]QPN58938.1 hypothetical protein H8F24_12510 [Synechococcus sp. CBW1002]